MTKYIGNIPIVGKKATVAFGAHCEKCGKEKLFYWVSPYGFTIRKTIFLRLFCTQAGLTPKSILYSFHTILLFFKIRKAVEIGACETCGSIKIKCRHCGTIKDFEKWQETYICPNCNKKSYMFANHPLPTPWSYFDVDIP